MNRPTPERSDESEEMMGRIIAEAGNPTVDIRPQHAGELRALLLDQLDPQPTRRSWKTGLLVGSGIAAAVIAAITLALSRPAFAWTEVADALKKQSWIHGRIMNAEGKQEGETWYSPTMEVAAYRVGPEIGYRDYKLKSLSKYVPSENTIYQLPENPADSVRGIDFYRRLLDAKRLDKSPYQGLDLVKQTRRDVEEQGRKWIDVELNLRVISSPQTIVRRVFRFDPETKLLDSWTNLVAGDATATSTTKIDYPDRGPTDIYDLNIPRTAKVINRIPADDLTRLLAGLKAGRNRFDNYCGFVVDNPGRPSNVNRVWRKGRRWRVDGLHARRGEIALPQNLNVAWWREHQRDFVILPMAICDGERTWYYRLKENNPRFDLPDPPAVKLDLTIEIYGPEDDPLVPWSHLFPEQLGHQPVSQPSEDREMRIDPKPDDGPPGTIRLRVCSPAALRPIYPDVFRLWVKPDQNYLSMRSEGSVFDRSTPPKLLYIQTYILEELARSPQGYWYPTRVRRKTTGFESEPVTNFYLDFEAKIPDKLFQPLKLAE